MALDVNALATALAQVDINIITQSYISSGLIPPPEIDSETRASIEARASAYAQAIYSWLLTATVNTNVSTSVNTTHASGTVNVVGTAAAQSNVVPIVGTGIGTGNGIGTLS